MRASPILQSAGPSPSRAVIPWLRSLLVLLCLTVANGAAAARVELVYFGAPDCFYCQHWEAARRPELLDLIRGRDARLDRKSTRLNSSH